MWALRFRWPCHVVGGPHVNLAHRGTGSEKAILARNILAKLILRTATSIVLPLTYDPAILQCRKEGQAILQRDGAFRSRIGGYAREALTR
jgi:hypothetical protein